MTQPPQPRPDHVERPESDPQPTAAPGPGRRADAGARSQPDDLRAVAANPTQELPRRVLNPGHPTAVLPAVPAAPGTAAPGPATPGSASARTSSGASAAPGPVVRPNGDSSLGRRGTGVPGLLAVAGLAGLGVSLFALPIEGRGGPVFFNDLRSAAARSGSTGADSLAGRPVATLWWRYGALIGFGVLAALVALMVSFAVLRRAGAGLLVVASFAVGTLLAYGGYQTADLNRQQARGRFVRVSVRHLELGFWIALGCCAVLALAALSAVSQRRR